MGKFYLHRDGKLMGTGTCQDGMEKYQGGGGLSVGVGDPPGTMTVSIAPDLPYFARRRAEYPPVEDQMDALWHAMRVGTLPKIEPFYTQIATVKDAHPKPSN